MVRRPVEMDGDGVAVGGSGGGREIVVYVLWGVSWTNGGGGKVTYVGGWMKCMVLKEDRGLEEVRRKVREITDNPCADFDANYEGDIVEVTYQQGADVDRGKSWSASGAVRYSVMFTQYKAYVHRDKSWCDEAYTHRGKPWCGSGTPSFRFVVSVGCAPYSIPLDALVNAVVHIGYAVG
ncbi:hypothetical protein Cgig2_034202 [Carnegiea gigantea]|uniref:Uncharacterized protein n=1 Tax=Carnegiea gigantea TaxID=171969 RepID=A0A9Q1K3L9_9CARY|nr:hypothetical protein Cgig2_034202 [Carnegiea gigantea]